MKLLEGNQIDKLQWDELIKNSVTGNFFQTPECFEFYNSLSFLKPFIYGISINNKLHALVCGYLISDGGKIKQFFSRRAIIPGGLLIAKEAGNETIEIFLNLFAKELKKRAIYIEFRNYIDFKTYIKAFQKSGFNYYPHLNFHLPTLDKENVWSKLSKSKRRQINISLKAGAVIAEAKTDDEIKEYYELINNLYKYKIKLPLFPVEFFEKLCKSGVGKILLVKFGNKVIGGITCVTFIDHAVYEWFVCGDDNYNKQIHSSVLATWAGIEYAINNNFRYFDFMGAGKPDTGYGVFEFKSKFGGNKVEDGRFVRINNRVLFLIGKITIKLIQTIRFR